MGGDEFVFLLPNAELSFIQGRVEELSFLVAGAAMEVCGADFLRLSVGAAFYPEDGAHAEELLATADARMYQIKRQHHGEVLAARNLNRMASALQSQEYGPGAPEATGGRGDILSRLDGQAPTPASSVGLP